MQFAAGGLLVGLVGGLIIDYSMAYKTITPKKQSALQFGTLSVSPQLSITHEGDFSLGLNGRF
ncbi:MAG TPA: hypothetical protein EYN66_03495 [Myxococcales bacterium]|nr:hypothetical protein [Myxococcales bacterium]